MKLPPILLGNGDGVAIFRVEKYQLATKHENRTMDDRGIGGACNGTDGDLGGTPRLHLSRLRQAVRGLGGDVLSEWKSEWWKLAAGYAVGHQELGAGLARHPLVSKSYGSDGKAIEYLTCELFAARNDPVWKEKILKSLEVEPWVKNEIVEYSLSLEDTTVDEALRRRADRLRKNEIAGADKMMALYEIATVDSHRRSLKRAALPVR